MAAAAFKNPRNSDSESEEGETVHIYVHKNRLRKTWSDQETRAFLNCYNARKYEFTTRQKRSAFAHVLEDMRSQGLTDSSTTVRHLEARLRTLITAYKSTKDSANGVASCVAPFMVELKQTLEDSAAMSTTQTLQVGNKPYTALNYNSPHLVASVQPLADPLETTSSPPSRKRKATRESYWEKKIKLKEEEIKQRMALRKEAVERLIKSAEQRNKAQVDLMKKLLK